MSRVFSLATDLAGLSAARDNLTNPTANDLQTRTNRRLCDALATAPGEFASEWYFPAGLAQQFCAPYYDQNGDSPPAPQPPPFTGGQCPGVIYDIRYDREIRNSGCTGYSAPTTSSFQGPLTGPVTGVSVFSEAVNSSTIRDVLRVTHAGGVLETGASFRDSDCDLVARFSNFELQRRDGQPDDCGDPPEGPLQPDPNYSNPVDPTQPVEVTFGPNDTTINLDFDIRQDIDGDEYVNISGPSYEVNIGSNGGEPRLPESQPDATDGAPSQPTGDGGEVADDLTPEEEEQGIETIGYAWSLSNYPTNAGIVQDTNPDVFFTPLGNVQLVYDVNGSDRFSDNLPIRAASGTILRSDASLKVRAVRFNKRPDVGGITLTPIRRVRADAN